MVAKTRLTGKFTRKSIPGKPVQVQWAASHSSKLAYQDTRVWPAAKSPNLPPQKKQLFLTGWISRPIVARADFVHGWLRVA